MNKCMSCPSLEFFSTIRTFVVYGLRPPYPMPTTLAALETPGPKKLTVKLLEAVAARSPSAML